MQLLTAFVPVVSESVQPPVEVPVIVLCVPAAQVKVATVWVVPSVNFVFIPTSILKSAKVFESVITILPVVIVAAFQKLL